MILDGQNEFSDSQAITAAAASTNLIDLGIARDIGIGENLFVMIQVDTTFADTSSDSTLTVALETATDAAFSSPLTVQTLVTLAALSAAGTEFFIRISPAALQAFLRFIRLKYTPNNGNLSAGAVSAAIVKDPQFNKVYANSSVIDA